MNWNNVNFGGTGFLGQMWSAYKSAGLARPLITPRGRTYDSAKTITLQSVSPGCDLWYTLDDSHPSATNPEATLYDSDIPLVRSASGPIKVVAVRAGEADSLTASETYVFDLTKPAAPTLLT